MERRARPTSHTKAALGWGDAICVVFQQEGGQRSLLSRKGAPNSFTLNHLGALAVKNYVLGNIAKQRGQRFWTQAQAPVVRLRGAGAERVRAPHKVLVARAARARPSAMSKACLSRLQKEYQRLSKEPLPDIVAEPRCVRTCFFSSSLTLLRQL